MTKKQVGKERVYSTYTSRSQPITGGTGTQAGLEPGGRNPCRGHGGELLTGLFSQACSVCSFIESRTTGPGIGPPTVGWALTNREHALQLGVTEAFSQLRLLPLMTPAGVKLKREASQYSVLGTRATERRLRMRTALVG